MSQQNVHDTILPEEYEISHGDNGTTDPVILKLSCGFTIGNILTVVAKPADFFVINLRDNHENILLHFILKDVLVLNSYFEKWGPEETYPAIKKNERHCISISNEDDGYRIFVNGEELCFYKHRKNFLVKRCEIKNGRIMKITYGKESNDYGLWIISSGSKSNAMKYLQTNEPVPKDVILGDLKERIITWQKYRCKEESSKICANQLLYRVIDYGEQGTNETEHIVLNYGFIVNHVISTVGIAHRRFTIMFRDAANNILLSIGVRTDQNVIVLNTFLSQWGTEERPSIMPVQSNKKFSVTVAYESSGYRIFVDGLELAFYKHRSTNAIFKCEIAEGTLQKFSYGKNTPKWAILEPPKPTYINNFAEKETKTPFTLAFKQNFSVDSCILVSGYIESNAVQFKISLLDDDDCSILEFNPQFKENRIVRTAECNSSEEKDGGMPLVLDSKFTVAFVVEELCFRIYINGDDFATHPHQKLFNMLKKIKFENVKINKVTQMLAN